MKQKHPLPPLFAKNLQRLAKKKWPQYAICQHIVTFPCVFVFLQCKTLLEERVITNQPTFIFSVITANNMSGESIMQETI